MAAPSPVFGGAFAAGASMTRGTATAMAPPAAASPVSSLTSSQLMPPPPPVAESPARLGTEVGTTPLGDPPLGNAGSIGGGVGGMGGGIGGGSLASRTGFGGGGAAKPPVAPSPRRSSQKVQSFSALKATAATPSPMQQGRPGGASPLFGAPSSASPGTTAPLFGGTLAATPSPQGGLFGGGGGSGGGGLFGGMASGASTPGTPGDGGVVQLSPMGGLFGAPPS